MAELFEHHDVVMLHNGEALYTHPETACEGQTCSIHNPSDHSMKHFPQHWRNDRNLMERLCPHGVGHPDPDDLDYKRRTRGDEFAGYEGIHGCDGCCAEVA